MPVSKPSIKFNVKSLVPVFRSHALTNLKTPQGKGVDPNYNLFLTFKVDLPEIADYTPVLNCEVIDHIFFGLSQPLLGHFGI